MSSKSSTNSGLRNGNATVSATPRSLLENLMQTTHVQGTIKANRTRKRKSEHENMPNRAVSKVTSQVEEESQVNSLVTPRTALMGVISSSEIMNTVAHPSKQRSTPVHFATKNKKMLAQPPLSLVKNIPEYNDRLHEELVLLNKKRRAQKQLSRSAKDIDSDLISQDESVKREQGQTHQTWSNVHKSHDSSSAASAQDLMNSLQTHLVALRKKKAQEAQSEKLKSAEESSEAAAVNQDEEFLVDESNTSGHVTDQVVKPQAENRLSSSGTADVVPPSADESSSDSGPLHLSRSFEGPKRNISKSSNDDDRPADSPSLDHFDQQKRDDSDDEDVVENDNNATEADFVSDAIEADVPRAAEPVTSEPENLRGTQEASSRSVEQRTSKQKPVLPRMEPRYRREVKPKEKISERQIPISRSQLAGILKHFCANKISGDGISAAEEVFEKFFRNLSEDLEATCQHANRRMITKDDVELVMRRQNFIDDQHPLRVLIEENFPLEYRDILLSCAGGRACSPDANASGSKGGR